MTNLTSSLNQVHKHTLAAVNNIAYISGGDWDKVQRWDGVYATSLDAGIPAAPTDWAPSPTTGAGNADAGTHLVRYRYIDERTGYVSNASNTYTATSSGTSFTFNVAASGTANVNRSTDAKVTHIVLEATTSGGAEFYEVTRIRNAGVATVVYNVTDATLSESTFDYPDTGHNQPPYAQIIHPHRHIMFYGGSVIHSEGTVAVSSGSTTASGAATGWTAATADRYMQISGANDQYKIETFSSATKVLFDRAYAATSNTTASYEIYKTNPNVLWHSHPLYPESVPTTYFTKVLQDSGDRLRGIASFGSDLIVMGEATMEKWVYSTIPSQDGELVRIPGNRGVCWHKCAVFIEGRLYGMDRQGCWVYSGDGAPHHISAPIDDIILEDIDWSKSEEFHASWHPITRTIRWFYCESTDTRPYKYIEFEIDTNEWGTGGFDMAISASGNIVANGRTRVLYGDENGYPWWADTSTTDGANPNWPTSLRVLSGSTASAIYFQTASAYTANNGLKGCPAYWVQGNETVIVTSNTSSAMWPISDYSSAPATSNTIEFGRINAKLKSKAISIHDLSEEQKMRYLHLYFEPLSTSATLYVRIYKDYSSTAKSDWVADTDGKPGVTMPDATSDIEVDISKSDGYARVPLGLDVYRVVEVELEIKESNVQLELLGFQVDGWVDEYQEMG